ncbi:MAG: hypothetical protein H6832_12790 [Planctomycetes bacterium]|nr:hypothetical protein [Planctomycetota bacterium]
MRSVTGHATRVSHRTPFVLHWALAGMGALSITALQEVAAQDGAENAEAQVAASNGEALAPGAVSLNDGRFVFGVPVVRTKDGARIHYEHGVINVPSSMIRDMLPSTSEVEYVPANEKEKELIAKGMVNFQGKWLTQDAAARRMEKLQKELTERIEKQQERKSWAKHISVETKDFKFEHNLPDELFDNLKDLMEVYHKTFLKYWGKRPEGKVKPTINFYSDYGDFAQISGASGGIVGWYHPISKQLHVYWDRTDPDFTIDVLFHEANHMLVDMIDGPFRYPHWIEEPMAEYYGASKWDPEKKEMEIGRVQAGRFAEILYEMQEDKWMKLEDLVGSSSYRSYTWGWSFVYFLMKTPKYEKKWKKLWLDLAHKRGVKRSFEGPFKTVETEIVKEMLLKYLGHEVLETLEREWHDFLKNVKIDELDGLEQAGRKLRTMGKNTEAKDMLSQAVEKGAQSPFTYAAYAQLLTKPGERKRAFEMIDKAIQLDPLEAEFYYIKGKMTEVTANEKDMLEAVRLYSLAHDIDPLPWKYVEAAEFAK